MTHLNASFPAPALRLVDWASLMLSLNWVYEAAVPPDGHGRRDNPDLSAWLLRRGSVRVQFAAADPVSAAAGDWVFLPAGERTQEFSPDAELLSICWRARWPDGRPFLRHGLPLLVPSADVPALETTARRLLAFALGHLQDDPLPTWRLRASVRVAAETFFEGETLLLEWMRALLPALASRQVFPSLHEVPDERVLLALEQLEYLPLRQAVKIADLAASVGLSLSQLNRLFMQHLGRTPKAHLHLRRLTEAKHLLQSGDLTVKEVADCVGFSSQSAFCHWFTREVGCNPRTFARQTPPPVE